MRRLAALTALTMATSSVAIAQAPGRDYDYERDDGGYYDNMPPPQHPPPQYSPPQHDRSARRYYDRGYTRDRWVPLADSYSASSERQFINVMGRGGRFNRLMVQGVRGTPVINRIYVEYEGRGSQTIELNRRLRRGGDEIVELRGHRPIRRIVVYTDPSYRGVYSLYGA